MVVVRRGWKTKSCQTCVTVHFHNKNWIGIHTDKTQSRDRRTCIYTISYNIYISFQYSTVQYSVAYCSTNIPALWGHLVDTIEHWNARVLGHWQNRVGPRIREIWQWAESILSGRWDWPDPDWHPDWWQVLSLTWNWFFDPPTEICPFFATNCRGRGVSVFSSDCRHCYYYCHCYWTWWCCLAVIGVRFAIGAKGRRASRTVWVPALEMRWQ